MKNSVLKILTVCMLLVVALSFSACASIRTMTMIEDNGEILQIVSIELDENEVQDSGYSILDVTKYISTTATNMAENYYNNCVKNLKDRIKTSDDKIKSSKMKSALLEENFSVYTTHWQGNIFTIGLRFCNYDTYCTVYDIDPTQQADQIEEKHFLYTKIIQKNKTYFYNNAEIYGLIKADLIEKFPNLIKDDSGELLYTMVSDLRREHSDADYIEHINGKYYHTWVIDANDMNKEITSYYNVANRGNCMLICVLAAVGVALILIGTALIINKVKNKKSDLNIDLD